MLESLENDCFYKKKENLSLTDFFSKFLPKAKSLAALTFTHLLVGCECLVRQGRARLASGGRLRPGHDLHPRLTPEEGERGRR